MSGIEWHGNIYLTHVAESCCSFWEKHKTKTNCNQSPQDRKKCKVVCFHVTSNFNLALPDTVIFHVVHLTQRHTVSPPHAYTVYLIRVIVYIVSQLLPLSLFFATFWSKRPYKFCGFPLRHFGRPPSPAGPSAWCGGCWVVGVGWWWWWGGGGEGGGGWGFRLNNT